MFLLHKRKSVGWQQNLTMSLCFQLFKISGRLREIQTLKRENQVVEYGLFAICSPAHGGNTHSASAIKKEVAITAQKRLERASSDPLGSR